MTLAEMIVSYFLSAGLVFLIVFGLWGVGFHLGGRLPALLWAPIIFGFFYLGLMLVDSIRMY